MGKPRSGVLLNPAARTATGRERRSGDLRRRQSAPSALLPALASGLRRPLRIVLEVTTAGLTAFSASFRCTLRVFSKIAFTTSTLSHVLGLQSGLGDAGAGAPVGLEARLAEVRVIFPWRQLVARAPVKASNQSPDRSRHDQHDRRDRPAPQQYSEVPASCAAVERTAPRQEAGCMPRCMCRTPRSCACRSAATLTAARVTI